MSEQGSSTEKFLLKLLEEYRRREAIKQLRKEHSYAVDLIDVLRHYSQGWHRTQVIEAVKQIRRRAGLPIPARFEQTVQSAFQGHAAEYADFKRRKTPSSGDLFYAPGGKGSGMWTVKLDKATAWLKARVDGDQ